MKINYHFLSAVCLALAGVITAGATTVEFSYNVNKADIKNYGFDNAQAYDVAILIDQQDLVGKKITGISVPIPATDDQITLCQGWISKELKTESVDGTNKNVPDVTSADGVFANGMLSVTFAEPYTIEEGGVYVGYSFDMVEDNPAKRPMAVVISTSEKGFYYRTSKSRINWGSAVESTNYNSAMVVTLEGDFPENGARILMPERIDADAGEPFTFEAYVTNLGNVPVSSVEYTYEAGKYSGNGSSTWSVPAQGYYGVKFPITINVDKPILEPGNHELLVKITKVNGVDNEYSDTGETSNLVITGTFRPVKRPLVEEYTGLWCSFCPRGFVALEELAEEYPDTYVGISYHYNDEMQAQNLGGGFPAKVTSYPAGEIDRTGLGDGSNLKTGYTKYLAQTTNAAVNVTVKWTDENENAIEAESTLMFIENLNNAYYRVAHILVADGLTNPRYMQNNAFSGGNRQPSQTGKWWDLFFNGGGWVTGLTFNFVAAYSESTQGKDGTVPTTITAFQPITYKSTIQISDILNNDKEEFVKENTDYSKLRVVSVLVNGNTGEVVNCNISNYLGDEVPEEPEFSAVEAAAINTIVETVYYDLNGSKVAYPDHGMYIKIDTLGDGTRKVSKIVR